MKKNNKINLLSLNLEDDNDVKDTTKSKEKDPKAVHRTSLVKKIINFLGPKEVGIGLGVLIVISLLIGFIVYSSIKTGPSSEQTLVHTSRSTNKSKSQITDKNASEFKTKNKTTSRTSHKNQSKLSSKKSRSITKNTSDKKTTVENHTSTTSSPQAKQQVTQSTIVQESTTLPSRNPEKTQTSVSSNTVQSSYTKPTEPIVTYTQVDLTTYIGKQAEAVTSSLREMGATVTVQYIDADNQPTGTIVDIDGSGTEATLYVAN